MDPARAFERLLAAYNAPRDEGVIRAAFADDAILFRFPPGPRSDVRVSESFRGIAAAIAWFARTPPRIAFSLVGEPRAEGDEWVIGYALAVDDFTNGGEWRASLAEDGRVSVLSHHPFALNS